MFHCSKCTKEFKSQKGLNAHQICHSDRSTRYSIPRQTKEKKTFLCQYCSKENKEKKNTHNKFCNSQCCGNYKWENITKPNVINGNGTNETLKKYISETFGYKCSSCGINEWNGKKISLHLDHIDGNSDNNDISNGRLLCPNCHSQTETYCARNRKNTKRNSYLQVYKSNFKQVGKGR